MTVIRPNSVSGINSITAQTNEIKVFKSDGTQGGLIIGGANLNATSGISTLLALNVTGNVSIAGTLTYQDVTNVDSLGIGTFRTGINVSGGQLDVGSNIKLGNAGVITATSFVGSGANLTGTLDVAGISTFRDDVKVNVDSKKILLGAGADLEVFHNGTNSHLRTQTGDLIIDNNSGGAVKIRPKIGEEGVVCTTDGSTALYHDGTKKLETASGGIEVTGAYALVASSGNNPTIDNADGGNKRSLYFKTGGSARLIIQEDGHTRPASNNTYDLGTTGDRWRNIYTNDLNLSNKGSTNCVDNTWGDYTIQEGESDLFLINNRSGKKYKFNLTEVN